jgi:hypothetical protein
MAQGVSLEFKTLYCKKKIPWLALVTAVTPLPAKTFYVKLFVIVTKYLRRIFKGRNYSFWLTVSEVSSVKEGRMSQRKELCIVVVLNITRCRVKEHRKGTGKYRSPKDILPVMYFL